MGAIEGTPERCADGEAAAAEVAAEGAGRSEYEVLSWGAGEGAIAIAALIVKRGRRSVQWWRKGKKSENKASRAPSVVFWALSRRRPILARNESVDKARNEERPSGAGLALADARKMCKGSERE